LHYDGRCLRWRIDSDADDAVIMMRDVDVDVVLDDVLDAAAAMMMMGTDIIMVAYILLPSPFLPFYNIYYCFMPQQVMIPHYHY
jgi:hypothetical protein